MTITRQMVMAMVKMVMAAMMMARMVMVGMVMAADGVCVCVCLCVCLCVCVCVCVSSLIPDCLCVRCVSLPQVLSLCSMFKAEE